MLAVRCEEDYLPDVEDPFWFFFHFSTFLLQYTLKSCTTVRCEVCWVCEVPCTLHLAPCNFCWVPCNHFTRNFFLRSSFPITSLHKYVSFNTSIMYKQKNMQYTNELRHLPKIGTSKKFKKIETVQLDKQIHFPRFC